MPTSVGGLRVHYRTLDLSGSPEELRLDAGALAASLLELVVRPVAM